MNDLPLAGWDEWYVISEKRALATLPVLEVFVNDSAFTPYALEAGPEWEWDPQTIRLSEERTERFWRQLATVRPLAFLADGFQGLTCVLNNEKLFERVIDVVAEWVRSAPIYTAQLREQREDQAFLKSLGDETGPEECAEPGCSRRRLWP